MKSATISLCAVTLTLAAAMPGVSFAAAGAELAEDADATSVFDTPLSPAGDSGADDSLSEVANEATLMNSIHVDASEREEPADRSLLASWKANEQQEEEEEDGRQLRMGRQRYWGPSPSTQRTSSVVKNPGAVRSFNSNNNCVMFQGKVNYQSVKTSQFSARNNPGRPKFDLVVVDKGLLYTVKTVNANSVLFFDDADDSTRVESSMETVPMGKTYYGVGNCQRGWSGGNRRHLRGGNRQLPWRGYGYYRGRGRGSSNNNNNNDVRSNNDNVDAGDLDCDLYACQPVGSVRNAGNSQKGLVYSQDGTNILFVAEDDSSSSSSSD